MNIPINCPICHDPLVNAFNDTTDKVVYKNCRLRPDHIFSCAVFLKGFMDNEYEMDTLDRVVFTLSMNPPLSVEISVDDTMEKIMDIDKCFPSSTATLTKHAQELPFYVEPDFTNFPKLCEKIRLFVLLS